MINPIGMEVIEWTDRMATFLPVTTYKLEDPDHWQDWARHVVQSSTVSIYNPPQPAEFSDWRDWAERFIQTVPDLG